MAIVEVKVPQLSESVAEATLLQWKKRPGERVEMDEILVEIETDKVVLEVPAPASGVLAQLVKNDGDLCVAEEVIAKIDTEGVEATSPLEVKPVPAGEPAPGATPAAEGATAAGAAVGIACTGSGLDMALPSVSILAITSSARQLSPSFLTSCAITPEAGAGTSSTTLSVSISTRISSISTASPGRFFHSRRVASATDSESCGTLTSTIAM